MQGMLELWINAFIPRDVPNYTQTVPAGKHGGKTAVPMPWEARLHPGNTFKNLNEGYLTDQRGFSDQKPASVRMQSSATVTVSPHFLRAHGNGPTSSGTTSVDLKNGNELDTAKANLTKCLIKPDFGPRNYVDILTRNEVPYGAKSVIIDLFGAGSDPLVWMSADINYEGSFQVIFFPQREVLEVSFVGLVDAFPAFEAYCNFNYQTQALFTLSPPPGNTVMNLPMGANRPVTGNVSWPMR